MPGRILVPPVIQLFRSKWLHFFFQWTWNLFHDIFKKDLNLQANLKAEPKLNAAVLHPGSMKQSVPLALAIFDPCTSVAINTYFPEKKVSASFLRLFHTWWIISNSKMKENLSHRLGDAAKRGKNKPIFLGEFADWIEEWNNLRTSKWDTFTLSSQASEALRRTLRATACLIEDLLSEDYEFVLNSRQR